MNEYAGKVWHGIHHSKYWMPIHQYDFIEDGQNKRKISSFCLIL